MSILCAVVIAWAVARFLSGPVLDLTIWLLGVAFSIPEAVINEVKLWRDV